MINETVQKLIEAEEKAAWLFKTIHERGLIVPGKTERELNAEVFALALELLGVKKYWHKRIVRAGKNTLLPYKENPPDLILQEDDIVFFDFGPVLEDWEADVGRTYVIGNDPKKIKLKKDVELAWKDGLKFYKDNIQTITAAEFYNFTKDLACKYGWHYGNIHCGHLIGNFPHEKILGDEFSNYIHPGNHELMSNKDKLGNERHWIYEIHLIDKESEIGGFFEQLMH
jgi:Xaa-Pro aminopeptidase